MERRQLLQGGLAATPLLAGCLTFADGGATPDRRLVSISDRDPRPDLPVHPTIEVVEPLASDAGPPELVATVENRAAHPVQVGEERAIIFAFVYSEEPPGLVLLPADGEYPAVEPGCWRIAEPVAIAEYYGVVSLAPGESTRRRLGIWAIPDGQGCLPTGRFRFETRYAGARDRGEGLEEQEWTGTWGFTLEVA